MSTTRGPHSAASGRSSVEVEAVERGGVAAEHHAAPRRLGTPAKRAAERLLRERVAGLLVRVVAAPHDPVDADLRRGSAPPTGG